MPASSRIETLEEDGVLFISFRDRLLFDVGHQAYAHKMLTGRRALMPTLKKEGGLSGFTKVSENEHDAITVSPGRRASRAT